MKERAALRYQRIESSVKVSKSSSGSPDRPFQIRRCAIRKRLTRGLYTSVDIQCDRGNASNQLHKTATCH